MIDHPYFVCATPRSGSLLLCELLSATGETGRPAERFATWGAFLNFLVGLRERPDTGRFKPAAAVAHVLPGVGYVHMRRRDKVAQAVALFASEQPDAGYDFAAIEQRREQITAQDQAWARWFTASGLEPVTVFYEDLLHDPRAVVRDVLRALHIDLHFAELPTNLRDPAAAGPRAWAERFEHERKAALA